ADRNRSHWSTSKTPSYTKSVSWQHHLSYDLYKQAPVLVDNVLKMLSPDGSVRQLAQSESQVG
ncbi:hypothetical protein VC838_09395, partial [Citrobacter freundii]|nr:hypothetical protein [Citrobacter freundii]